MVLLKARGGVDALGAVLMNATGSERLGGKGAALLGSLETSKEERSVDAKASVSLYSTTFML